MHIYNMNEYHSKLQFPVRTPPRHMHEYYVYDVNESLDTYMYAIQYRRNITRSLTLQRSCTPTHAWIMWCYYREAITEDGSTHTDTCSSWATAEWTRLAISSFLSILTVHWREKKEKTKKTMRNKSSLDHNRMARRRWWVGKRGDRKWEWHW